MLSDRSRPCSNSVSSTREVSAPSIGVRFRAPLRPSVHSTFRPTTYAVTSLSADFSASSTTLGVPPGRSRDSTRTPCPPCRVNQVTTSRVMRKLLASPVTGSALTAPEMPLRMP